MEQRDLTFVIPTYRLRDVGETVEQYDQHFWRNGHSVRIVVFDDSSPANQEKYFPILEQTHTHNAVYYVGPREKEQFIAYLNERLRDVRLEGLVRNLFRPSYGGNRNCTLMYTLGGLMVSADDDMRPFALMEDSPESLQVDEISRGRLHKAGKGQTVHGKILHETRLGELAALREIPFGRYYGSVDSTPLFVMLAGAYWERTGDGAFIRSLWPAVNAALEWIDRYGDVDGDGFVEYQRQSSAGLLHQGWKDADDAIVHEDGTIADGPVALCEVQGYVYAARIAAASIATALGFSTRADELLQQADILKTAFDRAFWCQDLDTYALALDGLKRQCRVRSSNAGQCLFSGIVTPERAEALARTLMDVESFSGWGIRTLAATERRYNPMGYHTGAVWPHDNALIGKGLARYGFRREPARLFQSMFQASLHFDLQRMPELFCGFQRVPAETPIPYPVACAPQAWASGSVFLLLQACLGARVDGRASRILFDQPSLPAGLAELWIQALPVGERRIDLRIVRHGSALEVDVVSPTQAVEVVVS